MCERKFLERVSVHAAAGDVDQRIDAAVIGFDLVESRLHFGFFASGRRAEMTVDMPRLRNSAMTSLPASSFISRSTTSLFLPGEALGDGLADSSGSSRYDGDFAHLCLL